MRKVEEFSRVLDLLNNDEKDKLLISAKGLMLAQKALQTNLTKKNHGKRVKIRKNDKRVK
jgi:hypothetical protein